MATYTKPVAKATQPVQQTEKKEHTFVGKVDTIQTQYGELIKISFGDKDRETLEKTKNEKGWNNLVLKKSKDAQKGYYLEVDTFVPVKQN